MLRFTPATSQRYKFVTRALGIKCYKHGAQCHRPHAEPRHVFYVGSQPKLVYWQLVHSSSAGCRIKAKGFSVSFDQALQNCRRAARRMRLQLTAVNQPFSSVYFDCCYYDTMEDPQ